MKPIYIIAFLIFLTSCKNEKREDSPLKLNIKEQKKDFALSAEIRSKLIEYKNSVVNTSKYSDTQLVYSVIFGKDTNENAYFILIANYNIPLLLDNIKVKKGTDSYEEIEELEHSKVIDPIGAFSFNNDYIVIFDDNDSSDILDNYYNKNYFDNDLLKELIRKREFNNAYAKIPYWYYLKKRNKFVLHKVNGKRVKNDFNIQNDLKRLNITINNFVDSVYSEDTSSKKHRNNLWVDFYKYNGDIFAKLKFSYYYKPNYLSFRIYRNCLITFYDDDNFLRENIFRNYNQRIPETYLIENKVPKAPYKHLTKTVKLNQ